MTFCTIWPLNTLLYFRVFKGLFRAVLTIPHFCPLTLANWFPCLSRFSRGMLLVSTDRSLMIPFAFHTLYESVKLLSLGSIWLRPLQLCVPVEIIMPSTEAPGLHVDLGTLPAVVCLQNMWVKKQGALLLLSLHDTPAVSRSQATRATSGQNKISGRVHVCGSKPNLREAVVVRNRIQRKTTEANTKRFGGSSQRQRKSKSHKPWKWETRESLRLKSEESRECLWDEFPPIHFHPHALCSRCKFYVLHQDARQSSITHAMHWTKEVGGIQTEVPPRPLCSERRMAGQCKNKVLVIFTTFSLMRGFFSSVLFNFQISGIFLITFHYWFLI